MYEFLTQPRYQHAEGAVTAFTSLTSGCWFLPGAPRWGTQCPLACFCAITQFLQVCLCLPPPQARSTSKAGRVCLPSHIEKFKAMSNVSLGDTRGHTLLPGFFRSVSAGRTPQGKESAQPLLQASGSRPCPSHFTMLLQ